MPLFDCQACSHLLECLRCGLYLGLKQRQDFGLAPIALVKRLLQALKVAAFHRGVERVLTTFHMALNTLPL